MLAQLWHRVTGTQPSPPLWLVAVCGALALAAVLHHPAWRISRNVVTIAHEGGHAIASLAVGRRLEGIRLHSDTSGLTFSRGKPTGAGVVVTTAAGYVTPSLLGLGGAGLLAAGHVTAMLWALIAALAAMFIAVRNLFGVVSILGSAAVVLVVTRFASAAEQEAFAYLFTWFLLLGGVRPVIELQRRRRMGRASGSDADQLARLTRIPGTVWVAAFGVVSLAALLAGARWLIPPGASLHL
jgi:hypothetical protein